MLETFLKLAQNLFSYQEFWAVFKLFQATLWVLLLVVIFIAAMHVLYLLGRQTPLYKRRSPRSNWSKRFFRGTVATVLLIFTVLAGAEWLEKNTPHSDHAQTIFTQLLPAIQNIGR